MAVWSMTAAYEKALLDSPVLVADGLVLRLDAGNSASYPGTGTTWTNLGTAGSAANGTLTNGPTFSTSGGGSLVFDGVDDFVNITVTRTASCTFSAWATITSFSGINPMLFIAGPDSSGPDLYFSSGVIAWNSWDGTTASFGSIPATANNGNWHNYVVVVDAVANSTKLYYDGSLLGTTTYKSAAVSTNLRIAASTGYWPGKVAHFMVNNIAFTASQVTSNFSTLRTRFGA